MDQPKPKPKSMPVIEQSLEDERSPRGDTKSTINSKREVPTVHIFMENAEDPAQNNQNAAIKNARGKKIKIKDW